MHSTQVENLMGEVFLLVVLAADNMGGVGFDTQIQSFQCKRQSWGIPHIHVMMYLGIAAKG